MISKDGYKNLRREGNNMTQEKILPDDVVLKIENLSIAFGGLKAVDNLSFDIKENENLWINWAKWSRQDYCI